MKDKKCPLCSEKIYSEIGKGCKMCGMIVEDESKDFCSKKCRMKYEEINNEINIIRMWGV